MHVWECVWWVWVCVWVGVGVCVGGCASLAIVKHPVLPLFEADGCCTHFIYCYYYKLLLIPSLESQGCHLIPLCYLLSCSSA